MADPTKIITHGGAKFDANQVASQSTTEKNGKTYYVVEFKSGAKVQYPAQPERNEARIDVGRDEAAYQIGHWYDSAQMARIYDNLGKKGYENFCGEEGNIFEKADQYTISQFWGLEFSGSQKPDNVNLRGCTRCTVNVSGGNSYARDMVTLEQSSKFVSQHNEVIMDAKDVTSEIDNKGIAINQVQGSGIHHEGDNRDKLK